MTIGLTPNPTLPNLNDPGTFNDRAQALFLWLTATLIPEIEALDANDWFSAQSTFDDATVGKVLKVGAFGLGNSGQHTVFSGSALKEITVTGFHRYASASHSDAPSTVGIVLHLNRLPSSGSGGMTQIAFGSAGEIFYRYLTAVSPTTYSSWFRVYNASNILGTVSQSGGTPTGKLFEYGTNANGEYLRFPDGTQICWLLRTATDAISTAYFGGYRSAAAGATFAATFSVAPKAVATVLNQTAFAVEVTSTSTTGAVLRWLSISSEASATRDAHVIAVGRWF